MRSGPAVTLMLCAVLPLGAAELEAPLTLHAGFDETLQGLARGDGAVVSPSVLPPRPPYLSGSPTPSPWAMT